jgi:hypothetical protein
MRYAAYGMRASGCPGGADCSLFSFHCSLASGLPRWGIRYRAAPPGRLFTFHCSLALRRLFLCGPCASARYSPEMRFKWLHLKDLGTPVVPRECGKTAHWYS